MGNVSRMVGDIRRGPAWGPLEKLKQKSFNSEKYLTIERNL